MSATSTISPSRARPFWRELLEPYERPRLGRSLLDLATSVLPYFGLSYGMYRLLSVSAWLVLAVAPLAAGFLLRTYILFHDCSHGSLMPSKRANSWLGAVLGLVVFAPFARWKHDHAVHHATAGDLDRRGVGDLPTLTVAEYARRTPRGRLGYRLFRNPLVMFGLGPIFAMIIGPRIPSKGQRPRLRRSVKVTNLALLLYVGGLCVLMGPLNYLLVFAPAALMAGSAGIWLFYVQHQFEDTYWQSAEDWSYAEAALRGSSHLKLNRPLRFFTGNIGLHHVHHLSAQIPNYNLQRAHEENPVFHDVPTLTLLDGLRAVRLKLWDEERNRLVTFRQAAAAIARAEQAGASGRAARVAPGAAAG